MKSRKIIIAILLLGTFPKLFALNGMYHIGFGPDAKGVGGAATAFPQDTLTALANPANLVPVGKRIDLAPEYLRGTRIGKIRGSFIPGLTVDGDYDLSRNKNMVSAEAGIGYTFLNDRLAIGLTISPQAGGVITWGQSDPTYPFDDQPFHIDVMYVAFTPLFGAKIFENEWIGKHFLGVGIDLTPARLKISGLQALRDFGGILGGTDSPNHVTNNGWDWAFGYAVRIGWLWEFRPWISGGLAFRTKTYMTHFDKYKGVISPHGRADLPAIFFGGIAVKPFVQTTIALDIGRIYNGNVDTFANSPYIFNATLTPVNPHGASNGAGFGWKSSTVYKIGIAQDIADSLTIRAGYNYGQLPWDVNIPNTNAVYGTWILPTTIRHHLTLGASLELGAQILNAAFVYGFKHSVHGPIHPIAGGGNLETSTDLITLQIGFSKVW